MTTGTPLWLDVETGRDYPPLQDDMEVDVAIVGGGIVGLHCAWRLMDSGLRVVVLEARRIGRQATGRSTAKVTSQHGRKYSSFKSSFGEAGARCYAEANEDAVATIAALASGMEDGAGLEPRSAYVYATDDEQAKQLEEEAETARSLGLQAKLVGEAGLPFPTTRLLQFTGQYQFDPYRYLAGLAESVHDSVAVFEHSRVAGIDRNGAGGRLEVNRRTVSARQVVVATQMPVVNEGMYFAKAFPFSHPVAAAPLPDGITLDGMFISVGEPSHSLRTAKRHGREFLVAAGGEYKSGHAHEMQRMEEDLRRFLKDAFGIGELSHLWTNEDFRPMDGAAFVGPAGGEESILVATGFDAWGITQGVVAADILAARILGQDHPAADLFDSTRFKPLAGGVEFTKENLSAARHLARDRMLKLGAVPIDSIVPGGAGVVEHRGEQLAVRKDKDGTVRALSAVCTHLGCVIGWNGTDRTWDCPCHGSRFDEHGEVLAGPAVAPLSPRDLS